MTGGRFPEGFRWGVATAAHQIEGSNTANDWWAFESRPDSSVAEPSGEACDSWNRWSEDHDLVASLGVDDYRFSIEWSRIEPEPGGWSDDAMDHYVRISEDLRARGIGPVVTFHHFTTPQWVTELGGWENPETANLFAGFCQRAAARLDGLMVRACTINEPNIVALMGWGLGVFPPARRDRWAVGKVTEVFVDAHRKAAAAIRAGAPDIPVGLTLSMSEWVAVGGGEERLERYRARMEDVFLQATTGDDFVGVQTYSRVRVGPDGLLEPEPGVETLIMGYEYWPQALEATLRRAWEVTGGATPLLVTENGIGTDDDRQRIAYVNDALAGVLRVIADGIRVDGYTYWSLLDNFEWALGYAPEFGLHSVDRATFRRTPKPSASWFAEVVRNNALSAAPEAQSVDG
ncbi:MAG TPA: family 1 glycosylhydrolase [Acidimicrobiales bacterium]|nr:family 1 glycosylhydrolase [Acidimicrobiales bacterium]